jgi:hypothetical protein
MADDRQSGFDAGVRQSLLDVVLERLQKAGKVGAVTGFQWPQHAKHNTL